MRSSTSLRKQRLALICVLISFFVAATAQSQTGTIVGSVKSKDTGEPLPGGTIVVIGTGRGAASDVSGQFQITDVPAGSHKVRGVYVGYKEIIREVTLAAGETATLDFVLEASSIIGDMVVVSASRKAEKVTEAPATVDVIDAMAVAQLPSFNVGELLSHQKGVDYVRTGVLGTGINVRGFNNSFNSKNLQMTDGRISTLIATNLPLGALNTTVKDDIDRIEIILGPSATLYGPNAHNGLLNTITKDPRTSQGTTFAISGGNQSVFDGRVRHAQVLSDKFAFKVDAEYLRGIEFNFVDSVYVGGKAYEELDLDRKFNSIRGGAALFYSVDPQSDIIVEYGGSNSNNIGNTNAGRNQIIDWRIHFLQTRYVSPRLFAQFYYTWSATDETYAMNQRTQNYRSFIAAGFSDEDARRRSFKEAWTGTLAAGRSLARGAVFVDNSRRINGEVQYNNEWNGFNAIVGGQWQKDIADSKNTYLLDQNGAIKINQIGFYGQIEKPLGDTGLKAVVAARGDNHDLYGFNFIPRGGLLYSGPSGTWRLTYGKGIASPSILNLSANIFGGLLLGNGEGFTVRDSNGVVSKIEPLKVETIQTIELGYKGTVANKLYIDADAYYNVSENFLSPALNIAPPKGAVTQRGGQPIQELIAGTLPSGSTFVLTYLNFGKVKTYGGDIGLNYFFSNQVSATLNYSYFNFSLDKADLKNDGDKNGKVTDVDLPINTPKHKVGLGLNVNESNWFGSIFLRWVDKYDYFSGINVAAKTNTDLVIGGDKLRENARVGRTFNYGPLGGFVNVDIGGGYRITSNLTISAQVVNVFDASVRDFAASPIIGRLVSSEVKFTF